MIRFRIIATGKPPKDWRDAAFAHYVKLLSPYAKVECSFVKERRVDADPETALRKEAGDMIGLLSSGSHSFALDKSGSMRSTKNLSDHFRALLQRQSRFDFLIGGPWGLHADVLAASNEIMSLSKFTFPHDLARVMLAEQLYRVLSIHNNLPYHK